MSRLNYIGIVFCHLLIMMVFCHCKKDGDNASAIPNRGFVEYQYADTNISSIGDTVITPQFKTFTLSQACYRVDTSIALASPSDTLFRPIGLYLLSPGCVFGSATQPMGASLVTISLIDSINKQSLYPANGLTPFIYTQSTLNKFNNATAKKPVWLTINGKLGLQKDTTYTLSFLGENTKINSNVSVLYTGKNVYQIIASGTYNNLAYNINYTGEITQIK